MRDIRRIATLLVGFGFFGPSVLGQTDSNTKQKTQPAWLHQLLQERSKAGMMVDQHTSSIGSTYVPIDVAAKLICPLLFKVEMSEAIDAMRNVESM
jgi:hypothetical protein